MKFIIVMMSLLTLQACAGMSPDLYKTVDDIATDGVIQIQVDKEAFQKETNTSIMIDINNRDISSK